ncbi:Holliday junction resolvase RuvX [Mesomycoplasma hyorhinis]|uniref:Putative pre-16S rRNA nuclease n=1 Tax=Mesomycoplasma hyorhinis SK76 TaxID=1118964 RepID=A0AAI8AN99_MESHY|nr:Holliday junction resolvase RuvX [Mesomycoplasma hyorhinis]AFX74517.1 Putative Holliday junction resolvase [Mesomycoplasma hyorhinis SK76]MXR07021.1 Holliday junction resolvase RuvX [Mesomycoplasma hyorhinis]QEA02002.1 Holliday junction resolvase RuvX [Mesomycoplasma hyorhinis]UVT32146.1 Holliday junction resolvase RuvX [Mesomycoplasma hyorhinis]UVT32824.1 Holliday junction resolvase RuvX [Mesomycoplasma hyorhinis]
MKRIIALDLGSKNCGFAISDALRITSQPLENFQFKEHKLELVIEKLKDYFEKYEIELVLIGYPLSMQLNQTKSSKRVDYFVNLFKTHFDIPIKLVDERQTTKKAHSIMIEQGLSRQKRKKNKDKLAAQLILDDYLNQ